MAYGHAPSVAHNMNVSVASREMRPGNSNRSRDDRRGHYSSNSGGGSRPSHWVDPMAWNGSSR